MIQTPARATRTGFLLDIKRRAQQALPAVN